MNIKDGRPACWTHMTSDEQSVDWAKRKDEYNAKKIAAYSRAEQARQRRIKRCYGTVENMVLTKYGEEQVVEVQVDGGSRLAYKWRHFYQPLEVGSRVSVPAPWWAPDRQFGWRGTVVQIGSTYDGPMVAIESVDVID